MTPDQIIKYIENGIVIDHLPPGIAWKVAEILKLNDNREGRVSLGDNHTSKRDRGKKSFLKIEGGSLSSYEINLIALVAPSATLNIIRGGVVQEKKSLLLPDVLRGIIRCPNYNCVSNQEREKLLPVIYCKENKFLCHYCRQGFFRNEVSI